MSYIQGSIEGINLQSTLSASSAIVQLPIAIPHHPITCSNEKLQFEEDGTFRCEHGSVGPGDIRTQHCIDHSIALLLLEIARERFL